jgi:hypothetical protein
LILNFSDQSQQIDFEMPAQVLQYIFSTHKRASEPLSLHDLRIEPFEILIGELTSS